MPNVTRRAHASSPAESWEIVSRMPARWLRPYVRGLWGYTERTKGPMRRREMPSGGITVVFNLGPALYVQQSDAAGDRYASFAAGLHERYALTETDGEQSGVQLNLSPLGARALFGVPLHELAHRTVSLDDLLGRRVDDLVDGLAADRDAEARTARVETASTRPPRCAG